MSKYGKSLYLLVFILLIGCGLSQQPLSATAQGSGQSKAVWLWKTEQIKQSASDILSFSSNNHVNVIYLQMNADVNVSYYHSFIRQANLQGIQVDVLGGAPSWGLESERYKIDKFLNWVSDYQQAAASDEQFSGIHLDIEPHVLAEWKMDQASVISQWQNNVSYIIQQSAALHLPVSADIPFWLSNYMAADGNTTLSHYMISQYDSVTIMSYRDTADSIYGIAKKELMEADSIGKPAYLAVETKPSSEGDFISFYEEGADYMNSQLLQVDTLAEVHPSYTGIAIHDYDGWKALK